MTKQPLSEPASGPKPVRPYDIVGLQQADKMPISFEGHQYDLNDLSAGELAYLLQFPEQVPYLKKLDASLASD